MKIKFKSIVLSFVVCLLLCACVPPPEGPGDTGLDTYREMTGFAWAPDGQSFAFSYSNYVLVKNEAGIQEPRFREHLYRFSLDDPSPELLYVNQDNDLDLHVLAWSPQNQELILSGKTCLSFDLKSRTLKPLLDSQAGCEKMCFSGAEKHKIFLNSGVLTALKGQEVVPLALEDFDADAYINDVVCDKDSNAVYLSV